MKVCAILAEEEVWRDFPQFEEFYQISSYGRIKSKRRSIIMKLQKSCNGYLYTNLFVEGKSTTVRPHRTVAQVFVENLFSKNTVNHIDGDKTNNFYKNLEWKTQKENNHHAIEIGLVNNAGSGNPMAVLTENQVCEIRELFSTGRYSKRGLSRKFNIARSAIFDIVNYRTWRNI